jgi:cytochrome c oxidase subunit IV
MATSTEHPREHIVPIKTYGVVCATLLVFTFLTYRIAYVDLGAFNVVVAIVIACIKAALVVLFFMHAAYAPRRTRMVILAGLFWLMLLLGLTLADYLTRLLPR